VQAPFESLSLFGQCKAVDTMHPYLCRNGIRSGKPSCRALKRYLLTASLEYNARDSVIIRDSGASGMKSRPCVVWLLGLLLAIASVDTLPDPPAVNPRTGTIASFICEARGEVYERRLRSDSSLSSLLQVRWIVFTSAYEPNLPSDRIVLAGFATDPSPPAV
jgi:hypothetical protein